MSKPPVAIYARISQDRKKTEKGVSVQKADCLALAEEMGLEVVEIITENDVSAAGRKQRKGFERLKELAISKTITGVVVWHPDRLYRVLEDLEALIKICKRARRGFHVYSVRSSGVDLNSASGRQNARILTVVSQHEIDHKAERQSRAQLRIFDEGGWGGGRPPTGYKQGDTPGTLVIDEPVAEALRHVIERILTEQHTDPPFGITAATRVFRELTGKRSLKPVSLRGTLLGPSIIGMRSYLPEELKRAAYEDGEPIPEGTLGEAHWPPIIDTDTQEKLKEIIAATTRIGRPAKSLLSGILICGRCGTTLGYAKQSYKCNFTAGGCGRLGVSTRAIEEWVIDAIEQILTHGQFSSRLVPQPPIPIAPKEDEMEALRMREAYLTEMFALGRLKQPAYDKGMEQIELKADELQAAAKLRVAVAANQRNQVLNAATKWHNAGDDKTLRRTVIKAIWPEIVIRPTTKGKRSGTGFDAGRVRPSKKTGDQRISLRIRMKYQISEGIIPMPANPNPAVTGAT